MENKGNNGLVKGKSEPSTIGTYQTKSYSHEGVSGSKPVTRLNETNINAAITPQVMRENNMPSEKKVKDGVKKVSLGNGMPLDSGNFRK